MVIRSDGQIVVEAITEQLTFSRVAGILDNLEIEIPEQTQTIDFPQGLDNVALAQTEMAVHVTSAVGFNSGITLNIDGVNSTEAASSPASCDILGCAVIHRITWRLEGSE